jgi:transcriptional regulator with XRE-family HTH domain
VKFKIGKIIKERRLKVGLSQGKLAEAFGYASPQFISNIERGLCGIPADNILGLAKVLKINPEVLIAADVAEYERQLRERVKR